MDVTVVDVMEVVIVMLEVLLKVLVVDSAKTRVRGMMHTWGLLRSHIWGTPG